jgi:hypothetical protein
LRRSQSVIDLTARIHSELRAHATSQGGSASQPAAPLPMR